jgi:hypothetical protein
MFQRHISPAGIFNASSALDRKLPAGSHVLPDTGGAPSCADPEDTDIFSHGSPIREDFHPDNSVLDSDDGDESNTDGTSRNNVIVSIDTSTGNSSAHAQHLDAVYYQCRSARTAKMTLDLISISRDSTVGQKVTSATPCIGTFEDHSGIDKTFHGSRFQRGPLTVNQSISASFDLAKLICVSCDTKHVVISDCPLVLLFTDQNFVSSLSSPSKECINIVRIENASLEELFEISKEIFGNLKLPDGTVMCFGSTSHLGKVGTSIYARDWTNVVAHASAAWRGVRICPLIPLIVSDCPGTIAREITELGLLTYTATIRLDYMTVGRHCWMLWKNVPQDPTT